MSQSSRNSPSHMDDAGVARWDRPRWISVFSSHNPTIREVTECLGLGLSASSSTTNRGIPKFDNPEYRKLSGEVTRLSKELPKERDALLDFAADPNSLHRELEDLLATFGTAIWGRNTDRTCLLTPDPAKKTYPRHLFIEDPEDKEILKVHLHRWIIIKACYYIRNMKLKRPSSANDYDTVADMEVDGEPVSPNKTTQLSPNDTPHSLTPSTADGPTTGGAEYAVKPVNGKKRKSSAYASLSDGDEMDSTPAAKRYQSHTMPSSRSSPRKSIISFVADGPVSENSQNVPPMPSLPHSHSNGAHSATNGATPSDSTRPQLTTLSSNDLNGTARTPSAPPANGFTAVNTGSFTAINPSPPVRVSPSQKPVAPAPTTNGRNYSSPYDSSPFHGAPVAPKASTPPKAPPLVTASASATGFQAVNSPVVANGVSARNSPTVQHVQPPQLPSQHTIQAQPQPTSRSNTPIMHHHHRTGLTQQRSSRSSTPIAPSVTSQPMLQVQPAPAPLAQAHHSPRPSGAPLIQTTAGPIAQAQPPYTQPAPTTRVHHVVNVPPVSSAPVAYNAPQPAPILRSHPQEAAQLPPQAHVEMDLGLLQCEVLGSLMQYLFPRVTSPPDESVLLHKIESLWHLGTAHYRKETGQLYDLHSKILLTWITERRKIQQLRHTFAYSPAVPATEMVERLLALNDLRMMRLKWKSMSNAVGLSTEDLLCRTFTIMTNTAGTEHLFKDGLDRLNEGIFEFLRTEDMRILMHSKR
ncbi:uncharacterized protein N0V89_008832 [Didymosphaeria variabile]|uniref:Uncharacterized protein n=1 Tax=Didymosphaeria variabile TaxID=1932322 RepID=A0A9W9C8X1_9PLEO|nr:uncharacterized protein N0V89_008832 [Didymosphaeria variabile]KAJ4350211.1 hypothetical protein N0V89_008832 [Didymosphaeria variabile]